MSRINNMMILQLSVVYPQVGPVCKELDVLLQFVDEARQDDLLSTRTRPFCFVLFVLLGGFLGLFFESLSFLRSIVNLLFALASTCTPLISMREIIYSADGLLLLFSA